MPITFAVAAMADPDPAHRHGREPLVQICIAVDEVDATGLLLPRLIRRGERDGLDRSALGDR